MFYQFLNQEVTFQVFFSPMWLLGLSYTDSMVDSESLLEDCPGTFPPWSPHDPFILIFFLYSKLPPRSPFQYFWQVLQRQIPGYRVRHGTMWGLASDPPPHVSEAHSPLQGSFVL